MKNFHTLARHNRGTSEDVNENNMADGDVAEVDTGNTPGNRRTNKRPETEENKRKSSLQWTQQGIFTRKPDTLTTIIEEGRPMLNDYLRYAKVGGGQHGEVYLCQRLNPKAGHGDPDRRIPVVRSTPILGFAVRRLLSVFFFFFWSGSQSSEEK